MSGYECSWQDNNESLSTRTPGEDETEEIDKGKDDEEIVKVFMADEVDTMSVDHVNDINVFVSNVCDLYQLHLFERN